MILPTKREYRHWYPNQHMVSGAAGGFSAILPPMTMRLGQNQRQDSSSPPWSIEPKKGYGRDVVARQDQLACVCRISRLTKCQAAVPKKPDFKVLSLALVRPESPIRLAVRVSDAHCTSWRDSSEEGRKELGVQHLLTGSDEANLLWPRAHREVANGSHSHRHSRSSVNEPGLFPVFLFSDDS